MTAPVPSIEPTTFAAGETVLWTKSVPDYLNTDGWGLVYSIRGPTTFADVTATNIADGSYSVTITATTTGPLLPGAYQWASHAVKGSGASLERYKIARGTIVVTPNLVTAGVLTTHASRTLAMIEAALEGRVPADMQQYQIAGRQITKIPVLELYGLRSRYQAEVARERNPKKSNPVSLVNFVSP